MSFSPQSLRSAPRDPSDGFEWQTRWDKGEKTVSKAMMESFSKRFNRHTVIDAEQFLALEPYRSLLTDADVEPLLLVRRFKELLENPEGTPRYELVQYALHDLRGLMNLVGNYPLQGIVKEAVQSKLGDLKQLLDFTQSIDEGAWSIPGLIQWSGEKGFSTVEAEKMLTHFQRERAHHP